MPAASSPVYTKHNAMHGLTGDPVTKTQIQELLVYLNSLGSWIPIIGTRYQEGGRVLSRTFFQQVCNFAYILTVNMNRPLFALVLVLSLWQTAAEHS